MEKLTSFSVFKWVTRNRTILLYRSDPMISARPAVFFFLCAHRQSVMSNGEERKQNRTVCGRDVDLEELTYGARGGAVVVGGGRERHVSVRGHSGLWFGHDISEPIFQESPSSGEVSVCGRYRIDFCSHFVRSGGILWRREVGERKNAQTKALSAEDRPKTCGG